MKNILSYHENIELVEEVERKSSTLPEGQDEGHHRVRAFAARQSFGVAWRALRVVKWANYDIQCLVDMVNFQCALKQSKWYIILQKKTRFDC